ncbi:MAG: hypothetical protein OQL20_09040, partial [Sedimenticola sp.]|nr:hypothetical protein [Sedimenticola sp.]
MNDQRPSGRYLRLLICLQLLSLLFSGVAFSQDSNQTTQPEAVAIATAGPTTSETLASFVELQKTLQKDILLLSKKIVATQSDTEKAELKGQLDKLKSDLANTTRNFENIAAGVDMTVLRGEEEEA